MRVPKGLPEWRHVSLLLLCFGLLITACGEGSAERVVSSDVSTASPGAAASVIAATTSTPSSSPSTDREWSELFVSGEFESSGYTCHADPTQGCGETDAFHLAEARILHGDTEYADVPDGWGLIDFWPTADHYKPSGREWGVRLVQLEDRPVLGPGVAPISGQAWVEVTLSDFSAEPFVSPDDELPVRVYPTGPPGPVLEMVLVGRTDDMMQWVVALDRPGEYEYVAHTEAYPPRVVHIRKVSLAGGAIPWSPDPDQSYQTYDYATAHYPCGPDPLLGCRGDPPIDVIARLNRAQLVSHPEGPDRDVGCIWFTIWRPGGRAPFPGLGWASRITQLDHPPDLGPGTEPLGGQAWLEMVIPGVTAQQWKADYPTRIQLNDPLQPIVEMVLIDTTDDMMRWVVAVDDPGIYEFQAHRWSDPFVIHIRNAP